MAFRSGINGTLYINPTPGGALASGTELPINEWTMQDSNDVVEFKNSLVGSRPQVAATYNNASGTVDLDWSDATQPFATPISLQAGMVIGPLSLMVSKADTLGNLVPLAIITSWTQRLQRTGKMGVQISWRASSDTITTAGGTTY